MEFRRRTRESLLSARLGVPRSRGTVNKRAKNASRNLLCRQGPGRGLGHVIAEGKPAAKISDIDGTFGIPGFAEETFDFLSVGQFNRPNSERRGDGSHQ